VGDIGLCGEGGELTVELSDSQSMLSNGVVIDLFSASLITSHLSQLHPNLAVLLIQHQRKGWLQ